MLCALILYVSGGTHSLKSIRTTKFLRNFFMVGLYTLRVFARNLLRGSHRRNIFSYFIFDDWLGIRTQAFASNKPTYWTTATFWRNIAAHINNVLKNWTDRVDYYLWAAVTDKCYADKPETIDALMDNIHEAIGKIQLHTIDNVLKNWID